MRTISLLGSTGSIGRQSLDVIAACRMSVAAVTANRSVELLEQQVRQFPARTGSLLCPDAAADLKVRIADTGTRVASGMAGLLEAATLPEADTVLTAVVGMIGLQPTLAAIEQQKRIALANKETLVCAGELVMRRAAECGAEIIPGGQRALGDLPVPPGEPGSGRGQAADPDGVGRAIFWLESGEALRVTRAER